MPTPEQRIRAFYGFAFPDDFFAFREFMAELPRDALAEVCDMRPAFPFEVAAGRGATDYPDQPAWEDRFYNDQPEFVTLFRGSMGGLHHGYFFDAPGELPPICAHFYNSDTFQHDPNGDTLFEAARYHLEKGVFWYHEWRQRLPSRPTAARELRLHAARDFAYAVVFGSLAWAEWRGWLAWVFGAVLAFEVLITLWDFIEEDISRPLPAGERVMHTVMAIVYGAFLANLVPVLVR